MDSKNCNSQHVKTNNHKLPLNDLLVLSNEGGSNCRNTICLLSRDRHYCSRGPFRGAHRFSSLGSRATGTNHSFAATAATPASTVPPTTQSRAFSRPENSQLFPFSAFAPRVAEPRRAQSQIHQILWYGLINAFQVSLSKREK